MATSHDYDGALSFVAPAGGATAGTMIQDTTTKCLIFPCTTATSGNAYVGKIFGRVNGVTRLTTVDWVTGHRLAFDGTAFTTVTTAAAQVVAHAAAAATGSTGDIVLRLPSANSPA